MKLGQTMLGYICDLNKAQQYRLSSTLLYLLNLLLNIIVFVRLLTPVCLYGVNVRSGV